jgi:hypothetical protein
MLMASVASLRERDKPLASGEVMATPPTDESLVAAAKPGDHVAFVEFWRDIRIRHSRQPIGS